MADHGERPAVGRERGDLLDLPLGGGERGGAVPPPPSPPGRGGPRFAWRLVVALAVAAALAVGVLAGYLWPRAAPPVARLEPPLIDFGDVALGGRGAPRALQLTNGGERPLHVESVTLSGEAAADFEVSSDDCSGRRLAAGESCSVELGFAPGESSAGRRAATLEVASNATNSPTTAAAVGAGVAPRLLADSEALDFGEVVAGETGPTRALTLENPGTVPVEVTAVSLTGASAQSFVRASDLCSASTLAPGDRCRLEITFAPQVPGPATAQLEVVGNARPAPVRLSGVGLAAGAAPEAASGEAAVEPSHLAFGRVLLGSASSPRQVRLTDAGAAPLGPIENGLSGADATAFVVDRDACAGRMLDPGASCEVELTFHPRREGTAQAVFTLAGESVSLAAEGVVPRLAVARDRLDFGEVRVSESGEERLEVGNVGSAPLTLRRLVVTGEAAADFQVTGATCGALDKPVTLAPQAACTLLLRFVPSVPGDRSATLGIEIGGSSGERQVALVGRAIPPPAPEIALEPSALGFPDVAVGERSPIVTLTLENRGSARLLFQPPVLAGAMPQDFQIVPGSCDGLKFLTPGSSCTVGFRFVPTAPGVRRATLVVRHNAQGGQSAVELSGRGETPPG